jgi:hypothetical protein
MLLPTLEWARRSLHPIKDNQEQQSCGSVIPIIDSEHIMLSLRMAHWSALLYQQVLQSTSSNARYLGMAVTTSQAIMVVFMYVSLLDGKQPVLIQYRVMALLLLCH